MENVESTTRKSLTVAFLSGAVLLGIGSKVLLESLIAIATGPVGRLLAQDLVRHGLPALIGFGFFLYLQLTPSVRSWGEDVVLELKKVVWPSREDTTRMAIVVCIMLVIAGIFIGLFDVVAGKVIEWLLNLNLFGRLG